MTTHRILFGKRPNLAGGIMERETCSFGAAHGRGGGAFEDYRTFENEHMIEISVHEWGVLFYFAHLLCLLRQVLVQLKNGPHPQQIPLPLLPLPLHRYSTKLFDYALGAGASLHLCCRDRLLERGRKGPCGAKRPGTRGLCKP